MTVSQVYRRPQGGRADRDAAGFRLIRHQQRSARRPAVPVRRRELHRRIDALIDAGVAAGVRPAELVSLVSARAFYRDSIGARTQSRHGRHCFRTPPPAMRASSRPASAARVTVEPLTLAALERDPDARARASYGRSGGDLRQPPARGDGAGCRDAKVVSISFIPSEETRQCAGRAGFAGARGRRLALPDFLPIMKAGVQRFAPHVAQLTGATLETPDLERCCRRSPTSWCSPAGAEDVLDRLKPARRRSNTGTPPTPRRSSGCWCR